jgi:hypothetical protein
MNTSKLATILAKQRSQKKSKYSIEKVQEAATILGRAGGKVGGPARAKVLDANQRRQIAIHAINARWGNPCGCDYCRNT